jgi:hypothetical protein
MHPFTLYAGTNRGVFRAHSVDGGLTWSWTEYNDDLAAAQVRDLDIHPRTGVMRAATFGRGAFEVDTDFPLGSVLAAQGRIRLLRVHDVGTGFGPASDFIDVEVVVRLDSEPRKAFGFQLRPDVVEPRNVAMLGSLRSALTRSVPVRIEYTRTGLRTGRIHRVTVTP